MSIKLESAGWVRQADGSRDYDLDRLEEWAQALKSGLYEQITHSLRGSLADEDDPEERYGYCCLGVACLVANQASPMIRLPWLDRQESQSFPSHAVSCYFGGDLRHLVLQVEGEDVPMTPAYLNDTRGRTFEEIGDAVLRYVAEARKRIG